MTFSVFRAKPDTETFDDFARGDPEVQKKVFDEWSTTGGGPLSTNGIEAGVKIRPTEQELAEMGPEFRRGWDSYFKDKPDKPVMHYSVIAGFFGDHMLLPPGKFFTMFHFLEYPFSRGSTHIVSPNPYDAPDFDAGFMNDARDMVCPLFPLKLYILLTPLSIGAHDLVIQEIARNSAPNGLLRRRGHGHAPALPLRFPCPGTRHGPGNDKGDRKSVV